MSDIIRLLPDTVANQIAAGEVIQRPSSVVKELMENSIDAGATLIQVRVVEAGKAEIQVIDNGCGLSETDARLAFERHATSKISQASDLFSLRTMGFRGEALPSIAAVAQVTLRTRQAGQELGTLLRIEGGRVMEETPDACAQGANFSVRNLFFNIPARRRFLKSNQTELGNVVQEFERIALAHPQLSFKLYSNDALLLDLEAGSFRQRIVGIFGRKTDQQLIPVETDTELSRITGFVGNPASSRKRGAHQFFFANGRFMRHPYFAKAVQSAFERLVPEGEQVPFFLCFDVDPSQIDVNIHPTKTEIKFENEQPLWQILQAAVRDALGKYNQVPTLDFEVGQRPALPAFAPDATLQPPRLHVNENYNPFRSTASAPHNWEQEFKMAFSGTDAPKPQPQLWTPQEQAPTVGDEPAPGASAEYIQLHGRYIVTTVKSGLMLVEQHRASVRILYDHYRRCLDTHRGPSQGLLFPQSFVLEQSEALVYETMSKSLQDIGFDISKEEGSGDYLIRGIPEGAEGLDPAELLHAILQQSAPAGRVVADELYHKMALTLARRAATPVGEILDAPTMARFMERLFASTTPGYTPDGLPVLTILDSAQIDQLF